MSFFQTLLKYKFAILIGFAFGALGVFAVDIVNFLTSFLQTISEIIVWPARFILNSFTSFGESSTTGILLAFLVSGAIYAVAAVLVQKLLESAGKK